MWILRWSLVAAIIIAILGFSHQNSQVIQVHIFKWQSNRIPLYLVAYGGFAAGMVLALLIASYHQILCQIRIRGYKKEISSLQSRLVALEDDEGVVDSDSRDSDDPEDEGINHDPRDR